jgi:hypothetical protein
VSEYEGLQSVHEVACFLEEYSGPHCPDKYFPSLRWKPIRTTAEWRCPIFYTVPTVSVFLYLSTIFAPPPVAVW